MPNPKDPNEKKTPDAETSSAPAQPPVTDESSAAVRNAVQEFSELVKNYGGTSGDRFVLSALLHAEVQLCFARRLQAKDIFIAVQCMPSIAEEVHVMFDFRCTPPRLSLIPVRFLAVLDAYTARLIRVVDPYNALIAQQEAGARPVNAPAAGQAPPSPFSTFIGNGLYPDLRR
ncbi:hypothetical protein HF313_24360 [Massilia atriviolacea]|uniref:Uncharacterized protein n=1 Tax=Massilia atriviolacea TaxID=2495579 RepID=A0A430HK12_9BURK|nr:hypothetical protein [Massilia atriviolacea]RSZ57855.1 hypothetical protein EJB06_16125 [Massilia atriviolacea]